MSTWFRKNLGDGILASEPLAHIQDLFRVEQAKCGMPEDMAVFVRYGTRGLHCEVEVYFSPVAADVARVFAAEPCARPAPEGLNLLVGTEGCRQRLFPEDGQL